MSKKSSSSFSAGRPTERSTNKKKETTLASLSDQPVMKRINVDIPLEEHTKLKVFATEQHMSIREVMREALRLYVANK